VSIWNVPLSVVILLLEEILLDSLYLPFLESIPGLSVGNVPDAPDCESQNYDRRDLHVVGAVSPITNSTVLTTVPAITPGIEIFDDLELALAPEVVSVFVPESLSVSMLALFPKVLSPEVLSPKAASVLFSLRFESLVRSHHLPKGRIISNTLEIYLTIVPNVGKADIHRIPYCWFKNSIDDGLSNTLNSHVEVSCIPMHAPVTRPRRNDSLDRALPGSSRSIKDEKACVIRDGEVEHRVIAFNDCRRTSCCRQRPCRS